MKITYFINNKYNPPADVRKWMSILIGQELDEGFGLFPPFYTDCGRNIHIEKNVFIINKTYASTDKQSGVIINF